MEKSLRERLAKPDSSLNWSLNFQKSLLLSMVNEQLLLLLLLLRERERGDDGWRKREKRAVK